MSRSPGSRSGARPPVAAGGFYPADPTRLAALVDRLLAAVDRPRIGGPLRALIAPHAGYAYSGAVAAAAWALVRTTDPPPRRIVLVGPAHFVPLDGAAVPAARSWWTPLGEVRIDETLRRAAGDAGARVDDAPHRPEHALEVQLPFLVRAAPRDVGVLPVAVGTMDTPEVTSLIGRLADVADLVVASTDLSHYHDDATARRLDRRTVEAIVACEAEAIGDRAACGVFALRGIVELARRLRWSPHLLERSTSADAGGDRDRVVGYAEVAFTS